MLDFTREFREMLTNLGLIATLIIRGSDIKYGINLPNFGWFGDIDTLVEIVVEVE